MMAQSQTRAQRKTAFIKAHLRQGEDWLDITIGNISTSGLMAKCQKHPLLGTNIEIRRRGIVIKGQVVWSTPTRFGLRSFEQIDVDAVTAVSGISVDLTRTEEPSRRGLWHWRR